MLTDIFLALFFLLELTKLYADRLGAGLKWQGVSLVKSARERGLE